MADVFDIDSGNRMDYLHHSELDNYNRQNHSGWVPLENTGLKDPRLRRDSSRVTTSLERNPLQLYDKLGIPVSPNRNRFAHSVSPQSRENNSARRMSGDQDGWHSPQRQPQMYAQPPLPPQNYQQPPPPPMYQHEHYNTGYPPSTTGVQYQQGYGQVYSQQPPPQPQFNSVRYNAPSSYELQQQTQPHGYSAQQQQQQQQQQHGEPGPPGEEYPGAWAPVTSGAYSNMSQQSPHMSRPSPAPQLSSADAKKDNLKKEAAIANEVKQQQATLLKQRDEYLRKASVLRRELEKLRIQKHELLSEKSPPCDSQRILRENAKLQLEIQNKLKSIHNVVDMLSGIIGDGLKMKDEDYTTNSESGSPKHSHNSRASAEDQNEGRVRSDSNVHSYNYIHYDPELHWCRVCDVFPRSAKDYLNHMHSAEHRQVTQDHQLVDTPWHKLPPDEELPSFKGAPVKRVPIKGLQFFISATAWYCKLCDTWIGDLHCASLHLKSKNHSHNYSNFVEQNPHWETNWIKDREKAYERCGKLKLHNESDVPQPPEPPNIQEKLKMKRQDKLESMLFDAKEKKRKRKAKKRKKKDSSGSSSSSSSSDSSSEEDDDKSKSIRVAMRNKMRMQAQLILKEEVEGKLEALNRLVEEDRRKKERQKEAERKNQEDANKVEDNIINQWMTVKTNNDKHILEGLKGRLKQRQELDKERAEQAALEQRKRERLREERELREMREREQREAVARMKEEQEREQNEREERERIKERERSRRRHRSSSESPNRFRRSRSKSIERQIRKRFQERNYRNQEKYKPKRSYDEDRNAYESHFEKQTAESAKTSKEKKTTTPVNRKLPFIGRMPLFKKKTNEDEKEIKKEEYDIRQTKFEPVNSVKAFIPAPGVVHIMKLATPQDPLQLIKINAENPPPPPQIIPEPPMISENNDDDEEAPPPPNITDLTEEEEIQAPPPMPEQDPKSKPGGNHLPRDFQEALNIIYPSDQRPDMAMSQDPNMMMQYQYGMGYSMMYPGMQMYDYTAQDQVMAEENASVPTMMMEQVPPPPGSNDDDLAMLGIDAGDMAAQTM